MDREQLKDLWIGDWVRVTLTGAIGKFEGEREGKVLVSINNHRQLIEIQFLEIAEAPVEDDLLKDLLPEDQTDSTRQTKPAFDTTLDLHLEKLEGYSSASGLSILEYQLKECRKFLEQLIDRKIGMAIIIHGKGEGVLKEAVIHLLGEFPQVKHYFPRNQGGALEMLLYY